MIKIEQKIKAHFKKYYNLECKECEKAFTPPYSQNPDINFCSITCRRAQRNRDMNQRRRVYGKSEFIEEINIRILFKRDLGICQICGLFLSLKTPWPDLKSATIDHIISITEGGENSYKNAQLSCLKCNSEKNSEMQRGFNI